VPRLFRRHVVQPVDKPPQARVDVARLRRLIDWLNDMPAVCGPAFAGAGPSSGGIGEEREMVMAHLVSGL